MAEERSSGGRSGGGRGRGGGRKRDAGGSDEAGEHLQGPERGTALITGGTFGVRGVVYSVVDDLAIFEGDIVLGTVAEVEQRNEIQRQAMQGRIESAVIITGADRRWPNCQVPFDIDPSLPDQSRVTDAIAHWQTHTRFRFIERTAANAASFPDWVTFRPSSGCSSSVGRQGGQQFVNLGPGCTTGNAIHEIGHTVGLWHEQSREDRDAFVTIHWASIQPGMEHNFDQHITDGDDVGAYDYGSIMHYPRNAFSRDGSDTITPINPASASIGQRTALSAGDIAAANVLCPGLPTIKEVPKDPITDTTIKEIRSDPPTIKEVRKDPITDTTVKEVNKDPIRDTRKELVRDTIKEQTKDPIRDTIKEQTGDPKGPLDPPPGTFVEPGPGQGPQLPGPVVDPGPVIGGQLGGPMPFAVATGHQAPALGAGGVGGAVPDPTSDIAAMDAALAQLADALQQVDAQREPLQQRYDELAAALAAAVQAAGGGGPV
jgi:hypothetical protein